MLTYQHGTSANNYRKKNRHLRSFNEPRGTTRNRKEKFGWNVTPSKNNANRANPDSLERRYAYFDHCDRDVQRTTKNSIKDEVSAEKISHSWYGHIHEVQSHGQKSNQLVKLPHEQSTMPIPNGLIVQVTCRLFSMFGRPWPFSMFLTDLQPRMNFNVGSMRSVRVTSGFLIVADENLYITIA